MANRCDLCNKGILIGHNVSFSKRRTRKVSKPNLQPFKGDLFGVRGKWKLCVKCLRIAKENVLQEKASAKAKGEKKA